MTDNPDKNLGITTTSYRNHSMPKIRLLLLDDHILFREGLVRLLATEDDFELVAQCGTCADALRLLDGYAIDLVLLDFDLGDDTGARFISAAESTGYPGKILLVTAGVSPIDSALLWDRGISGIFLKHGSPSTLLDAIRTTAAGRIWIDPKVESYSPTQRHSDGPRIGELLTPREQQVLRCVFEGLINKQIAVRLGVSQSSVKATLQQLFEKTGVRTRSQLVRFAVERSLETEKQL
jgi:DNA-binding NarL/FixJ family response regulator